MKAAKHAAIADIDRAKNISRKGSTGRQLIIAQSTIHTCTSKITHNQTSTSAYACSHDRLRHMSSPTVSATPIAILRSISSRSSEGHALTLQPPVVMLYSGLQTPHMMPVLFCRQVLLGPHAPGGHWRMTALMASSALLMWLLVFNARLEDPSYCNVDMFSDGTSNQAQEATKLPRYCGDEKQLYSGERLHWHSFWGRT